MTKPFHFLLLTLIIGILAQACSKKEPPVMPHWAFVPPLDLSLHYSNEGWQRELKYLYQPIQLPLSDPKIVINKKRHMLYLFSDNTLVRVYPINLGPDPIGDKEMSGDGRTPEGRFFICNKNPNSKYYKALGISYPSTEDAIRGLATGIITQREYRSIIEAITQGKMPPWDTSLGGAVCIHGGGLGWDWTRGCIALRNQDIDELFEVTSVGTPVIIIKGIPGYNRQIRWALGDGYYRGSLVSNSSSGQIHRSLD